MVRSRLTIVLKETGIRITQVINSSRLARETVFRAKKDSLIGSCTLDTLGAIAKALGVKIKDLFEED
ncbi:MAG: helix-turn-helix domain-containing protein [Syntrophobacteraceae bacterium]